MLKFTELLLIPIQEIQFPYLNVYYDGKGVGTITDIDGKYSIDYHPGWTKLTFSMVGYATQDDNSFF